MDETDLRPYEENPVWHKGPWYGKCPVHPKTIIEMVYGRRHMITNTGPAGLFSWKVSPRNIHVLSYRVVKEFTDD